MAKHWVGCVGRVRVRVGVSVWVRVRVSVGVRGAWQSIELVAMTGP